MTRKKSAPKYTAERASNILAEADFFGDSKTCQKWEITSQTLRNYRSRVKDDDELLQLLALKKRLLVTGWQEDAVKTIRVVLNQIQDRVKVASTEEDAKVIHAISGALKIVGELKIAADALSEADQVDEYSAD